MRKKIGIVILFSIIVVGIFIAINKNATSFKIKSSTAVIKAMENNQNGIYIFGFEECPWCQDLYPVLDKELIDEKLEAYLVDTRKEDFTVDNRSQLINFITSNTSFEDLIVPLVVMISKDGYFQYHVGTVGGYDASTTEINEQQKNELQADLRVMITNYKIHND